MHILCDLVRIITVTYHYVQAQDYKEEWDPAKFKSEKTGRGELKKDWKDTSEPVMCCYKLVECEFKWFGLQGMVESRIQKVSGKRKPGATPVYKLCLCESSNPGSTHFQSQSSNPPMDVG